MTLRSSDEVSGRCQITVVSCKTLGAAGTQGRPLQVVVRCNAYLDHLGQLRRKAVKVLFVRFDGEPLDLVACRNRFEEHAPGELGLAGLLGKSDRHLKLRDRDMLEDSAKCMDVATQDRT